MRDVTLVEASPLSPSVRLLRFACQDGQPLVFVPGQWVNLWIEAAGERHKRAYSLTGMAPDAQGLTFEVAVTRVAGGLVSEALHALPVGATCQVDGPHGLFTREGLRDQPTLFVGTGTGVCPLRAMLQEAFALTERPPLTLLFGGRHEADILFRSEFEAAAARYPNFRYEVTLSRPGAGWQGRRGYVQTHLSDLVDTSARPHVYICGLTHMVKAVRNELKTHLGYDRKQIHSERYD